MSDETYQERVETPLERNVRATIASQTPEGQTAQAEQEADKLLADIDSYVAETDPASLAEAERQLNAWELPADPLDEGTGIAGDEPLVTVFSAGTEAEANIVLGLLEGEGIPAVIAHVPTQAYGTVLMLPEGRWGDLLVAESQAAAAREAIVAIQKALPAAGEIPLSETIE